MKKSKGILSVIIVILAILIVGIIVLLVLKNIGNNENKKNLSKEENMNTAMYLSKEGTPYYIDNYDFEVSNKDDISRLLIDLSSIYGFSNDPSKEFTIASENEINGSKYYKLQQVYNGAKVYGYQLVVSTKDEKVTSVNGNYKKDIKLNNYKNLRDDEIKEVIKNNYGEEAEVISGEKVVYIKDDTIYNAYKVSIVTDTLMDVFIDAQKKEIIDRMVSFEGAKESYTYSSDYGNIEIAKDGDDYYIEDLNRNYYIVDGKSYDGYAKSPDIIHAISNMILRNKNDDELKVKMENGKLTYKDQDTLNEALYVKNNIDKTFDYYKSLGRNSYDGKGGKFKVFVNVDDKRFFRGDKEYNNAYWATNFNIMVIGKSEGESYGKCLDVMGHEFTHGVIGATADLIYQGESGALNESYADVMGSLIEGENFELGESINALRDMGNPSNYQDPSIKYGEYYFPTDGTIYTVEWCNEVKEKNNEIKVCSTDYDSGGVHTNSGVPNYAAYLSYTNGAFKDKTEMAKVYYTSLFSLPSNATFDQSAYALMKAAEDLGLAEDKINIMKEAFIKTKMIEVTPIKVTGRVLDENGNPLGGVEVKAAYKDNKNAFFQTYTTNEGYYTFDNLVPADYVMVYNYAKYESFESEKTIKEDTTLDDVKLTPIENNKSEKAEIVFVMDISQSMDDNDPKDIRKQMISNVIAELNNNYKLSLVTFAKNGAVNIDGINNNVENKNIITDVFNITNDDGYSENAGTNGRAGLTKALSLFKNNNARKYIVFFTDGEDTIKETDALTYDDIKNQANEKAIRIISIGLGSNLNKDVLDSLASSTKGKYFNATSSSKLKSYTKKLYDEIK